MTTTASPETLRKVSRWQWLERFRGRGWKFYVAVGGGVPIVLMSAVMGYYYGVFARMIDTRLEGGMQRADPRVFARPFELQRGQSVSPRQLIDRLNDLGYSHRERSEEPGQFTVGRNTLVLIPRDGERKGQVVRVVFATPRGKTAEPQSMVEFVWRPSYPALSFLILLPWTLLDGDPNALSVAALRSRSRMSERGKNVLSVWSSFDDPVTVLLEPSAHVPLGDGFREPGDLDVHQAPSACSINVASASWWSLNDPVAGDAAAGRARGGRPRGATDRLQGKRARRERAA